MDAYIQIWITLILNQCCSLLSDPVTPASMVGVSTSNHTCQPRLKYEVIIFPSYHKLQYRDNNMIRKQKNEQRKHVNKAAAITN